LIQAVMRGGRRIAPSPPLAEIRARAARDLERLPIPLRRLQPGASYPVEVAPSLIELGAEVDTRLARRQGRPS
jgi:nicotinate phosphoribosyltransferase